ncbi:A-kinase anchor protein 12-like [Catharus ustulatus]|uniref:A-kinase anchor protein 12-like n=1 Tax=Catharus ustulatus TaxID=91951 RepID=UPI001409A711|nr:A-kinase anchor protein 12-like [Catharus ustulatus]
MEASLAEETTEMVSAVSQLLETPDTTEEATPVQEVEATEQNLKELDKQTQKVLHEVAERVKSDVTQLVSERAVAETVITTAQGLESEVKGGAKDGSIVDQETVLLEQSLENEHKEDGPQQSAESIQGQNRVEDIVLPTGSEKSEIPSVMEKSTERHQGYVEDHKEVNEVQRRAEETLSHAEEFNSIKAITPKEELSAKQKPSEQEKLPVTELTLNGTRDDAVLNGIKSTEVTVPEVLLQSKEKTPAIPSKTDDSEADAEQSVSNGSDRDFAAKHSLAITEPQCRDKTTEAPSKSDEAKGGKVESAVLKCETQLESTSIVTEAPMQIEAHGASNLASTCPEIVENGSAVITDISPKKCETPSSLAGEETVGKGQELVETLSCQGFQKEDKKNEQLLEGAKEAFEYGKQEAVRHDECSAAVQQEEGSDSAFAQAESLGALKTPVAVAAAAGGKHVVAKTATHTDVTAKTAQPLATTPEQMVSQEVPVSNIDCSGCGTAELDSVEATKPGVTCTSMNGVSEEQEQPQSTE